MKQLQILVVGDDPANRETAGIVLRNDGWTVAEADSGEAAIAMVIAERYSLVLLDLQMPGLDGNVMAAAIRTTNDRNRHIPILAFTALRQPGVADVVRAAGMDGLITKPFTAASLIDAVTPWRPSPEIPGARLATIFGKAEIEALLDRLRGQLTEALSAIDRPGDRERIAHKLAGVAGTLGFPDVSRPWLAVSEGDETMIEEARVVARRLILRLDEPHQP